MSEQAGTNQSNKLNPLNSNAQNSEGSQRPQKRLSLCAKKFDPIIPKLPKSNENCKLMLPNGKEFELPIMRNTFGEPFLDISQLYQKSGMFTYDPGFMCTASCMSTITHLDGDKGKLLHRGYSIEQITKNGSYMELSYLLIYGVLPTKPEISQFESIVVSEMMVHEQLIQFFKGFKTGAHPMAIMTGVVGALSAFMHDSTDIFDPIAREYTAIKLIAKIPTIAAISYRTAMGLPIVYPKKQYSYIENFLYMMFSNPMEEFVLNKSIVKAIDIICQLHADHEQNASTSTVRIAGSSQANPFACIAAGIASLWGPAHGGANEAVLNMLEEIGSPENIPQFLEDVKKKSRRLMGFGHRVYKNFDPRAQVMKSICQDILAQLGDIRDQPLLDLAQQLEQIALSDDYFISRKLYPNVDFYTGIVFKAIGIPKTMFTVMFAMARSIGWICQWSEMLSETNIKIGRPRQIYVGQQERQYVNIEDRDNSDENLNINSLIHEVPKLNTFTNLPIL